jgi:hypothetical protein
VAIGKRTEAGEQMNRRTEEQRNRGIGEKIVKQKTYL